MLSALFLVVFELLLAERAVELALNRRNTKRLAARGAVWLGQDGFGLILAAQAVLFAGTFAEVAFTPWTSGPRLFPWTWPALVALALAQALRYWSIATLGDRWNIRVVTLPGAPRIRGGPYRWFPHPNYVAVMSEAILLPLAFGAWAILVAAGLIQALALWRRVRLEEAALGDTGEPGSRVA